MAVIPDPATGQVDLREPAGWRRDQEPDHDRPHVGSRSWSSWSRSVFVLITVISKGASVISWQFLTNGTIPPNVMPVGIGGMGAAVVGTLEITGFAALIAIPLGVLGAIYINEYGGNRILAKLISFMSDVMTGVPSIVMGLFIFTIWVLHFGYSGLAGSFALACLMLPIVIRSSYEMLRLVPDEPPAGQLRPRRHQGPRHADRGAARRDRRHRQRRAARRRPRGGRDSAAAVHHPHGGGHEHQPVQRRRHRAVHADLRERAVSRTSARRRAPGAAALTLIAIAFILMIVARLVTARFNRYSR